MKKPLELLISIIISIVLLSIIFPSDPKKTDLITQFRSYIKSGKKSAEIKNYTLGRLLQVDEDGSALIWSTDEKHLYYSKPSEDMGSDELWVSDLKEYKSNIESDIQLINIRNPKLSPDGKMLAFISGPEEKNSLILYNMNTGQFKDITPTKIFDIGITSYDWDTDSKNILMSLDLVSPSIQIYNIEMDEIKKFNIKLRNCRNAAFYKNGGIMFSQLDEDGKYKIYTADSRGGNITYIAEGWDFILSDDMNKIAILSDGDGQGNLSVYNIDSKKTVNLLSSPASNVYWVSDGSLLYSSERDSANAKVFEGDIHYYGNDGKQKIITGAIHTIFVPSESGNKIAMTSPAYMNGKKEEKGIFFGELLKDATKK
ncbi:MAG: hypothetical protein QME45_10785 [Clostridiales bacterium]|nr:hypothetical protein [Clostridiales bacterium]HBM80935.1 hypothetical protein [Clostridiaceae bacterium]